MAIESVIDLSPAHSLGFVMWPFCKIEYKFTVFAYLATVTQHRLWLKRTHTHLHTHLVAVLFCEFKAQFFAFFLRFPWVQFVCALCG